jgi:hypothetical protein
MQTVPGKGRNQAAEPQHDLVRRMLHFFLRAGRGESHEEIRDFQRG